MPHKVRPWEHLAEEDPAAGLLNLFDVWIAFAAALLLAMIGYHNQEMKTAGDPAIQRQLEEMERRGIKIERYRQTQDQLSGQGERLGIAYRLSSGEVVYVPETPARH
ncbi:MAG TPA: DUF2149 domain-containing protein [Bryobacteraceae bacterium]|nr:DUF2149 domain-containing protein [Bryobacteraceae bacterium]